MLCEFIGGPENGQREEIDDGCTAAYCTGLSREVVDWYERDPASQSRFLYRGQLTMAEYQARVEAERGPLDPRGWGNNQAPLPNWLKPEDLPEWAR